MTDHFELEEEQENSIEQQLNEEEFSNAVLFTTDWTVGTIIHQLEKGNIDVGPRFQRRDVWKINRKSRYIESLTLHLPVPSIVLAEKKDEKGKFMVLDGRQRLLTIMQFVGGAENSKNNNFKLSSLEVLTRLDKKNHTDLKKQHEQLHDQFENCTIRSVVVRNWKTEAFLHLLFTRLNTESTSLNAQELRLAAYPGEFVYFIDDESIKNKQLSKLMKKDQNEPDPRMRDAELLLRYFAFKNRIKYYNGPMRPFLDETCIALNDRWEAEENTFKEQLSELEHAIQLGTKCFGDDFGKRWDSEGNKYIGRTNRAVLDLQLYFLSQINPSDNDNWSSIFKETFQQAFEDDNFANSISATASHSQKSVDKFKILHKALEKANIKTTLPI